MEFIFEEKKKKKLLLGLAVIIPLICLKSFVGNWRYFILLYMQTSMLNNTDTYMELIILLMLWGFSSYLPSRDKYRARCTTKSILAPPKKATVQILHSQGNTFPLVSQCWRHLCFEYFLHSIWLCKNSSSLMSS